MCPQRVTPAAKTRTPTTSRQHHPTPKQRTLWDFIPPTIHPPIPPITVPTQHHAETPSTAPSDDLSTNTPAATPVVNPDSLSQTPTSTQINGIRTTPTMHQTPITPDKTNDPWGNIWALPTFTDTFRIVSKNTGTLNPQNLDMQAITHELLHM